MVKKAERFIKQYRWFLIIQVFLGVVTYWVMISQQLTNQFDAFWVGKYHLTGEWELSEGRFIWCLLSPLLFGMQTDIYTTLLALIFFALGLAVLHCIFYNKEKPNWVFYIACGIFMTSIGVRSQLSYRFQSPFFGLAFMCSMLSAWCIIYLKNNIKAIVTGAILLVISMGVYQVDLGCTMLVLLLYLMVLLISKETEAIIKFILRCVFSGVIGLIGYLVALKCSLLMNHIEITQRVGGGFTVSSVLTGIPSNLKRCIRFIYDYYYSELWHENMFQDHRLLYTGLLGLFAVEIIFILLKMLRDHRIWQAIVLIAAMFFVPVFGCCIFFLGDTTNMNIQTTIAVCMIAPLMLTVLWKAKPDNKYCGAVGKIMVLWAVVVLYGNFFAVQVDQQAMLEGTRALTHMTDDMIKDLEDEGYFDVPIEERKPVAVMGSAVRNEQFCVSKVFYDANIYARVGDFEHDCERVSWEAAFKELCYKNVDFVNLEEYFSLLEDEEVKQMPVYPANGYIIESDEFVILKVSD